MEQYEELIIKYEWDDQFVLEPIDDDSTYEEAF